MVGKKSTMRLLQVRNYELVQTDNRQFQQQFKKTASTTQASKTARLLPMNKMQIFKVFATFADVETHANHVWKKESVSRRLKCNKM